MGLGGLTVSTHASLRQRGARGAGLIETDTENTAIRPSQHHVGLTQITPGASLRTQVVFKDHRIHFFHSFTHKNQHPRSVEQDHISFWSHSGYLNKNEQHLIPPPVVIFAAAPDQVFFLAQNTSSSQLGAAPLSITALEHGRRVLCNLDNL